MAYLSGGPGRTAVAPVRIVSTPVGLAFCEPDTCPCENGECTLSRYARSAGDNPGGQHTLEETESAVAERLSGLKIDVNAMAAVSNIYRAAGTVRNHFERTVLAPHDLTWTGWVVLWVVWIWGDIETRHVAAEAGISMGTLTGVATTLESRGLLKRTTHPDDARRMLLSLTRSGQKLMDKVFPLFNAAEAFVVEDLTREEELVLARALRKIVLHVESVEPTEQLSPKLAAKKPAGGRR
jgi:DNA-binding MarR family transcriptional regulator